MSINFNFVKNKKNYYSFPPLIAALSSISPVNTSLVTADFLNNYSNNNPSQIDVFCFSHTSIAFTKELSYLKNIIPRLKDKHVLLIAGGAHATACPKDFLSLGFDIVVKGDGEKVISDIAKMLINNNHPKGVFQSKISSLDDYAPFPDNKNFYKPIEITRGCPYGCRYCQTSFLFSKIPLHRSIENIVFYIKKAYKWGIRDFRFISPNALGYGTLNDAPDIDKLSELLRNIRAVIKKTGRLFFGSFPSEIRPEFVTKEAMNLLKGLVDNKRVIIGAQSISEKILKLSKRGHTVDDIENAIENTLSAGFHADIDLIVGMPYEAEEDLEKTLSFIAKHRYNNVKFHLHYFMPLPGTPWQNKKPTPLPDFAIKEFKRLTGMGKVWGLWLAQKSYTKI